MIAADLDCRVVYCNPAVAAMAKLQSFAEAGCDLREAFAALGWAEAGQVLTPEALANGRMHSHLLAWMGEGRTDHAELQITLLVDDQNRAQGYVVLAR